MTVPIRAPLVGQILGDADAVTVVAAMHPLRASREVQQVPAGFSLAEIVDLIEVRAGRARLRGSFAVTIGVDPVPRDLWRSIRPKAGTVVTMRAVPLGSGGSLFKTIALLAVAVLTAFVAPYLTPILGTFGTALVTAAITVGAGLLLNALFPVNAKKDTGTVYSIAGNQNLATPYQPVPMLHGRMRVYPRYGASAYSEFVGDDQYLRLLYVWGYGPMDITEIKIGETPIEAYHDFEIQTFNGYSTDASPTLYPTSTIQKDLNIEIKQVDGWTKRTTSDRITEWAVDFACPNGLSATKRSGETVVLTVNIEIQQSVAYAEDWQPVETLTMAAKSTKAIRRTVGRPVTSGTYDIRWRRITPDTDGDATKQSTTVVSAMRSYRAEKPITFSKPVALTALRIRATSQLSGIIDNFNAVCTARGRAFNGSAWVADLPSSNPADQFVRALVGPANPRPVDDGKIDLSAIEQWWAFCVAKGYAYNKLHAEKQPVLNTLQDICSSGRAALVMRDGKWSVVWDALDVPVVQHFTTRNSWGFTGKRSYRHLAHAYRVKFKNEARGWQDDEIVAYADGYSAANATLYEEVEFPGQTDHVLCWQHGRYHDAQLRLRPEDYSLNADIEHLICTRGDRVRVTHDVPAWGLVSGRVAGIAAALVSFDELVTMAAGKTYCVRFRLADGSGVVRRVATVVGDTYEVTMTDAGANPARGDLFMFGEVDQETVVLRVKEITPGDDLTAVLALVDDAPAIQLADQGVPPDVVVVPPVVDPTTRLPSNLRVVEGTTDASGGYLPTVTFLWDTPAGGPLIDHFEVTLKPPGASDFGSPITVDAPARSTSWISLAAGTYTFRVRTLFTDGSWSNTASITSTIVSWSDSPPSVTGLRVDVYMGAALISWDPPDQYVLNTEIRFSPATAGATWETAGVAVTRTNAASVAVPFSAGSYLAKFSNGGGVYSADAAIVVATLSGVIPAAAEIFDYAPFLGTHDVTVEASQGVRLVADGSGVVVDTGTYQPSEVIALDAVYSVRLTGSVLAQGMDLRDAGLSTADIYGVDPTSWRVDLEISTTQSDPASGSAAWSPWAGLGSGDVVARGCRVRARLTSLADGISPVVELIHLRADVDPRVEAASDVAVPSGGVHVPFSAPFRTVPAVVATGRGLLPDDVVRITGRDAEGFDVEIVSTAGNFSSGSIDFIASGYGRRISA